MAELKKVRKGDRFGYVNTDTGIYLNLSNCPYHTGSSTSSGWTKYNNKSSYGTVDNKTVLEAMDDAASVALGGKWRIPTYEGWEELSNRLKAKPYLACAVAFLKLAVPTTA